MIRCDRCRKEIDEPHFGTNLGNKYGPRYDLCPSCWKKWAKHWDKYGKQQNTFDKAWAKYWYLIFEAWLEIKKEKVIFT